LSNSIRTLATNGAIPGHAVATEASSKRRLESPNGRFRGSSGKPARFTSAYHDVVNSLFFLLQTTRRDRPVWAPGEFESMVAHLAVGFAVAVAVFKLVPRVPWPRPLSWRFVAFHLLAAPVATAVWFFASLPIEWLFGGFTELDFATRFRERMVIGSFFYVLIAGLAYSAHGARRAAQAEAIAAQTQLATLRSQLQPHFLFNALHTIVQLIHIDARRATEAAELVADLLRRTVEEQRDEVPLSEEWQFVSRYLAVEQIRFGERLVVKTDLPPDLESERVPSFALQTLVENAVQHGAAPRVAPTEIAITGTRSKSDLVISVRNSGDRDASQTNGNGTGTGLARLRERLTVLYGGSATLTSRPLATGGYEAVLTVPAGNAGRPGSPRNHLSGA
jgi:two-component system LytT family sensor kinase